MQSFSEPCEWLVWNNRKDIDCEMRMNDGDVSLKNVVKCRIVILPIDKDTMESL